jgi:hypothetical protein
VVDIYRVSQPTTRQYTFFSAAHGTFSKIDILGHKAILNKFNKNQNNPLHHIRPQWDKTRYQQQKKPQKIFKIWRLNNTLLKKQWMTKVIREEFKNS